MKESNVTSSLRKITSPAAQLPTELQWAQTLTLVTATLHKVLCKGYKSASESAKVHT